MKVVITSVAALNGGDAAILLSIIELLKELEPAVEITVFDAKPRVSRRYYPEVPFRQLLWRRWKRSPAPSLARARLLAAAEAIAAGRTVLGRLLAPLAFRDLQAYAEADVVISSGGTYLVEAYRLEPRFFSFEVARRVGAPLVLFTQSLGPFNDPENRGRIRDFLGSAAVVLLRDERSRRYLADLGLNGNLRVAADVVFASAPEDLAERAGRRRLPEARSPRVGVSVRHWPHFRSQDAEEGMRAYREAVASAVTHLVQRHDAEVVFVSTCQGVREYRMDDSKVAREISEALPPSVRARVRVDDDFHTPSELVEIIGELDFVIATRMHMAILSLVAGTPVVPIAYEFKTAELFRRLEGREEMLDIETLDGEELCAAVDDFLETIDARRGELFEAVSTERDRAREAVKYLVEALPPDR
jgi:colanic acid/amylovoran biosynthesis protein